MSQLMEYTEYLSKEIGPRPAGTEEEQEAALYITELFQKETGFTAQIEEFSSTSNLDGIKAIPGAVTSIVSILAMIFPVLSIPAFILAAISAAIYLLEAYGRPIVTGSLARGASQNVVAKYRPNPEPQSGRRGRSRKVVLVAHYDSGKVTPALVKRIESLKLPVPVGQLCVIAMVAAAFLLLVHVVFNSGVFGIIVNILLVLCLILCAYPIVRTFLYRNAPYNEGANNNATGTAALLETARRISKGSVSEADLINNPELANIMIHGQDAAYAQGLVPEGAQILYEAQQLTPPSELGEMDDEQRLLAAKAAIAAMTGKPVERRSFDSVADQLVDARASEGSGALSGVPEVHPSEEGATEAPAAQVAEPAPTAQGQEFAGYEQTPHIPPVDLAQATPVVPVVSKPLSEYEEEETDGYKNAPAWFVAAQKNAKKPKSETSSIQRSRYAEALEAAERDREEAERERQEEELKAQQEEIAAALSAASADGQQAADQDAAEQGSADASAQDQSTTPEKADAAPAEGTQAEAAQEGAAEENADAAAPVFKPYAEAMAADGAGEPSAERKPAVDNFAATLGETTAFSPQAVEDAMAGAQAKPATPMPQPAIAQTAEAAEEGRLAALPTIDQQKAPAIPENTNPSRSGMFRKLRTDVPSMSGVIRMQEAGQDVSQPPVRQYVPAPPAHPQPPAPADETVAFEQQAGTPQQVGAPQQAPMPVQAGQPYQAPAQAAQPQASQAPQADQAYASDRPQRSERASAPRPRVSDNSGGGGGFLNRFRRKKAEELEQTPQEWLDIDEDFDARTVGRNRGGWESFRDDAYEEGAQTQANPNDRRWEGGAYSRVQLDHVDMRSGDDSNADLPVELVGEEDSQVAEEIEHIYHFRNPLYNTEIWFVALGADGASHDGAKAFLAEHADELRGSMLIQVESLGAGELSVASEEGRVSRIETSSRVKRYTQFASAATGIVPKSVSLLGYDSASSLMQEAGYQSMHLFGAEDGDIALKGSADDIMENIDEQLFEDHVNFIMELLKK